MTERVVAFGILQRIELQGQFASPLLAGQSNILRELVLGVLRWRLRLDYVISTLADRPAGRIDQRVLQILRLAIYELMFLSSPAYAVVNEAVSLAARRASRARGFVNAVLRKAAEADLQQVLPSNPEERRAVELAHPPWLLERWTARFGSERAAAIAAANQQQSRADLLVNTRQLSVHQAEEMLQHKQIRFARSELAERLLRLQESSGLLAEEIAGGLFHPMDEGSALVASLVGEGTRRVLDAAAAPGGKSLLLALAGHRVTSHDLSVARLRLVRDTAHRFGMPIHGTVAGDGATPAFRQQFDTVLLDAPCSGTGTIRKNPEIKWRLDRDCFAGFASLQRRLLLALLPQAAEECIYSTCSLEPEENDEVISAALSSRPEFEQIDLGDRLTPAAREWVSDGVLRLTPESGADGFTAFALRRRKPG